MTDPVLLWFRQDLRLSDQAALAAAAAEGPVIPVYVLDDELPRQWVMGGAQRWWLHHSLARLEAALRDKGSRLILRRGKSDDVLAQLARETGAGRVHALHHYEPWWRNAEKAVARHLDLRLHDGGLLLPPGAVRTGLSSLPLPLSQRCAGTARKHATLAPMSSRLAGKPRPVAACRLLKKPVMPTLATMNQVIAVA